MGEVFWKIWTAGCLIALVVMIPYGMWAYSEEAKK